MACSTSNSPVDISPANLVAGPESEYSICAEKCAYRYDYPDSTCNVTNEGEYLKIRYTRGNSAPVHYNSFALEVEELRLYTPSLHTYDGQHAAAELVIVHRGAGQALLVCIPIVTSTSNTAATAAVNTIVGACAAAALTEDQSIDVPIQNFTLNDFIPANKRFYAYSGGAPYPPCLGDYSYVVFSKADSVAGISPENVAALRELITEANVVVKNAKVLTKSRSGVGAPGGSNGGALGDDIYIDCAPVNEEGSEDYVPGVKAAELSAGNALATRVPARQSAAGGMSDKLDTGTKVGIVIGSIVGGAAIAYGVFRIIGHIRKKTQ